MTALRTKIALWLTPIIAAMLLLSAAYYTAHTRIIRQQIEQTTAQTLTIGGTELNQFLRLRGSEFELIMRLLDHCHSPGNNGTLASQSATALRHATGFSALGISAADGHTLHTELAASASNRYILRRDTQQADLLPEALRADLIQQLRQWQALIPVLDAELARLEAESAQLRDRGERNSQQFRDIQHQLAHLQEQKDTPPSMVVFSGRNQVEALGLPFTGDTFLFAQPLTHCDGSLAGFATAYLDRTQIENILYDIRQQLGTAGLKQVDVALVDRNTLTPLTEVRMLATLPLSAALLDAENVMPVPEKPDHLGASYPIAGSDWLQQLLNKYTPSQVHSHVPSMNADTASLRLLIAIGAAELEQRQHSLLLQVALWSLLMVAGLFVLIYYLSGHIVRPLADLKHSAQSLSQGKLLTPRHTERDDEIGELARSFAHMSRTLKEKEHQLFALATTDPLTGCLNRRAFSNAACEEYERARRSGRSLALCLMDLDHFKRVNDRYGHSLGDQVLEQFCHRTRSLLRSSDKLGRFGGEEFIVLLPDTSLEGAKLLAERLRQAIATMVIKEGETQVVPVTVSIGVTEWAPGSTYTETVSRADKLLYQAKAFGRNRVESQLEPETACPDNIEQACSVQRTEQ